jgi:(1->4)-alpha-D-glucan 1-alpha-D-glucosylmutase
MQDGEVFEATHALVLEWIRQGVVTGIRLDHVDGLFDPAEYFHRLLSACGSDRRIYLIGEKILSSGEPLRRDWPIHGTTGYDFLNDLNGLFVESKNARAFQRLYARFTGQEEMFADVAYESKKLIVMTAMVSELNMLARELNRISEVNRRYRDFTLASLQEALREVVACFPTYRTYCSAQGWDEFDQKSVDTAVTRALRRNPALESSIFEFIRQLLLPKPGVILREEQFPQGLEFAMRFQQYTGPVQAKGIEDTAFYRYGMLLSLNEVGGNPARFGRSPDDFHRANMERLQYWPVSMLATATHDTKRGEDVRARLNVLSEIPNEWRTMVSRWARANAGMRTLIDSSPAPDRRDEYMYYQSLLGTWPADMEEPDLDYVDRIREFMLKAIKEKKVHTSWINPSEPYDRATAEFVRRTLTGSHAKRFLQLFLPFARRISWLGMLNSLSQVVLKTASPGVPDFYQGAELWDLNLVDPDNRRPVDYALRRRCLEQIEPLLHGAEQSPPRAEAVRELLTHWEDGRIKLFVTATGLRLRKDMPDLFLEGIYIPLSVGGDRKDQIVALARVHGRHCAVAAVPRLVASLAGQKGVLPVGSEVWQDTALVLSSEIAGHKYRNVLTGEAVSPTPGAEGATLRIGKVLADCPVALLLGQGE